MGLFEKPIEYIKKYVFIKWLNPEKTLALFKNTDTGEEFVVPRSRLIPHPDHEKRYRQMGITDVQKLVEITAERSELFGITIDRWYFHKKSLGYLGLTHRDLEEAFYHPNDVDFSCVRDCVLEGYPTRFCIYYCSPSMRKEAEKIKPIKLVNDEIL